MDGDMIFKVGGRGIISYVRWFVCWSSFRVTVFFAVSVKCHISQTPFVSHFDLEFLHPDVLFNGLVLFHMCYSIQCVICTPTSVVHTLLLRSYCTRITSLMFQVYYDIFHLYWLLFIVYFVSAESSEVHYKVSIQWSRKLMLYMLNIF